MILALKKTLFSLLHIQIHQFLENKKGGTGLYYFFNLNFKNPENSLYPLSPTLPNFFNSSLELTS